MNPTKISIVSLILSATSFFVIGVLFWQFRNLSRLKKIFFKSKEDFDLEAPFVNFSSDLKQLADEQASMHDHVANLEHNLGFAIQKIGVHRFNPFAENGGNFSFTLALLDAHDNGVVVTSMHGREQNRIYSKNIRNGNSETQLTEEEKQALLLANEKFKTKSITAL